jgi:adenosine deaminase CECR1
MKYKRQEFIEGLDSNGAYFAAARHFFHSKPLIDASNVYQIIKMLPKGTALHMHDATVGPSDFAALELTKRPNLYYCIGADDHLLFRFFPSQPSEPCYLARNWASVQTLRSVASSEEHLNVWFQRSMNMYTPTPDVDYPDINRAWYFFEKKIDTISGIVNEVAALREFYYQTLQGFYDDNVMYIEMRGLLAGVYHLNQTVLSAIDTLKLYKEVTDEFVANNPDFWGGKFIYAPHRFQSPAEIGVKLNEAVQMKLAYPSYFAGFDLVGQEDVGYPLLYYLNELLDASAKNVKFFFHAGETAWHGTKIDENLLDAVLLNTTRFGHGYALTAHPHLIEVAQTKGIAVESCAISNQVLNLVRDFRNHPSTALIRKGFPLVVASDGPGIWGSSPLSHDWYISFMAIGGQHADLRYLKQLAINSIQYSAMDDAEKADAMIRWNVRWTKFLDDVITKYSQGRDNLGSRLSFLLPEQLIFTIVIIFLNLSKNM